MAGNVYALIVAIPVTEGHQERVTEADAGLQDAHDGGVPRLTHPQPHLALHPLYPPVTHVSV